MTEQEQGAAPGVLSELDDAGVLRLTLNRPEQRNALTGELAEELRARIAEAQPSAARVVVVTGTGSAFCAGADLGALTAGARSAADRRQILAEYYRAFLDLRDLPVPTIAAVNGPAIGAGFNLALVCDLRILAESSRLAAPFLRLGIHPGGGCSWMLTRTCGPAAAREILFLGEPVDSHRALQLGLAAQVVPDHELAARAHEMALRIATLPSRVVRDLKRSLALAEDGATFDSVLAVESLAQAESMGSEDAQEGWAAFRERRPPRFRDR